MPPELIIKVPLKARIPQKDYEGVPVKETYWTAGFQEGSSVRNLAPMNHATTCVLDGQSLEFDYDILLRDGNGLISLQPQARIILDIRDEGDFRAFTTIDLPRGAEQEILQRLGVFEANEQVSEIGIAPHYKRMEFIRRFLERG